MSMNQNNISNTFRTADLPLAAALCVSGFVARDVDAVSPRRSVFVYDTGSELQEAVNRYWRGELRIEPQAYFNQLKMLKARIYER